VELRREGLGKEISATPDYLPGILRGRDLFSYNAACAFLPDVAAGFPMRIGQQPANLLKRHQSRNHEGKGT
jgi:hypothetical protein